MYTSPKNVVFPEFQKNHVLSFFIDIWHSDLFVYDNDIPSVRITFSVGSLNTKIFLTL